MLLSATVDLPIAQQPNVPNRRQPSYPLMSTLRPDLRVSRHGQLAEAFEIFAVGMGPFIDSQMHDHFADEISWTEAAANRLGRPTEHGATDPLFQLLVLRRFWGPVFSSTFHHDLRRLVEQLIEARNLWAHFSLPDDTAYLDSVLLAIERILSPIEPDAVGDLRRIRARLKNPSPPDEQAELDVDQAALERQLVDTEAAFADLRRQQESLTNQLALARRANAGRQHRLSEMEQELLDAAGRSRVLETYLRNERMARSRMEWLFVGFMAAMLLVMVLLAT